MSKLSKKKVIGITGSMGSGKSEISRYLRKKYPVLDCDQVNADLLKKGNLGYQKLNDLRIVQPIVNQLENIKLNDWYVWSNGDLKNNKLEITKDYIPSS